MSSASGTRPRGTSTVKTYDSLQRPLGITVKGAANQTLMSRTYQYDLAGNITQIASELGQTQYNYDGVHNRTSSAHQAGAWARKRSNLFVGDGL